MIREMNRAYKGEEMAIKAACRAAQCSRSAICDGEEACALLDDYGWTWPDVLNASS